MVVYNKVDLTGDPGNDITIHKDAAAGSGGNLFGLSSAVPCYRISCTTGSGLQSLEDALARAVERIISPEGPSEISGARGVSGGVYGGLTGASSAAAASAVSSTMITRERHRRHVKLCVGHLDRFLRGTLPMDAAAEEIRSLSIALFVNINKLYSLDGFTTL